MKISQIIKEKRKHLGLTQENIAEYLGVSIPAVSKWENGTTYPDITLLPGLARLLKTDLNTLMSFNEEMSEVEINNVVMKVQSIIQEDGFEDGFQFALDQVRAFPTCENLIYSLGVFLQPSLGLQSVEHQSKYREELAKLYFRIRNSENIEIKKEAISFLFYLHCEGFIEAINQDIKNKYGFSISAVNVSNIWMDYLAIIQEQSVSYVHTDLEYMHHFLGDSPVQSSIPLYDVVSDGATKLYRYICDLLK